MKLIKVKVHENCQLLMLTDDADNVLTSAAFTNEEDTETAGDFICTLLIRLGMWEPPTGESLQPTTVKELLELVRNAYGDYQAYVQYLNEPAPF